MLNKFSSNRSIYEIIIVGLIYLYIFQPPILSKYIYLGVEFLLFFIFQLSSDFRPLRKFYAIFRVELNILFLIVLYAIIRDLLSGEIVYSDRMIYFTFQAFFFSSFLDWQFRNQDIGKILMKTGIFGSLITVAMMINPNINSIIMNYMKDELINYENFEIRYRGYGFSENITFTYSYVLGLCASMCLLKTKSNFLYSFPFLTCLIGVAFNARVGFIPIIITLFYSIFINKDIKHILKLIIGITLASCCLYFFLEKEIETYKETSWTWISSFFYDMSDSIFGTSFQSENSTLNTLTGSFIVLPNNLIEWIFGSGESLYLASEGNNTDIGYLLQLNYGGLIFLSFICYFMAYTSVRYWKLNKLKWFTIIYITSIMLLNYKGFFFAGTPGVRFIYLLYTWGIMRRYKSTIYNKKNNKRLTTMY